TISNFDLQRVYFPNVTKRGYIPSGRRRKGRSYSAAESRALIEQAIANTPVLPPVTKCPPGIASGTARYSEQFIAMKIGSTGKGGLNHWVERYTAGQEYEAWVAAHKSLSEKDRTVRDTALTAETLAEVGQAAGQSKMYADKRSGWRRALIAPNDNLAA